MSSSSSTDFSEFSKKQFNNPISSKFDSKNKSLETETDEKLFLINNNNLSVYLNNSLEKDLLLEGFITALDSNHYSVSYFPVRIPTYEIKF